MTTDKDTHKTSAAAEPQKDKADKVKPPSKRKFASIRTRDEEEVIHDPTPPTSEDNKDQYYKPCFPF